MKKASLHLMLAAALAFSAGCEGNRTETADTAITTDTTAAMTHDNDAVENAEERNEDKFKGKAENMSDFMVKAASGGMMEVELGKLAASKAANNDVKSFGEMMVKDHTAANNELKDLAAKLNVTLPAAIGEDHMEHVNKLTKLNGAEFDREYMDLMVNDHKEDVEMFEDAAESDYNADAKAWAAKTLTTLRQHLERAKQVNDMLEKK